MRLAMGPMEVPGGDHIIMEFGFFVDHFTFVAGLLFAAVQGPGDKMLLRGGTPQPTQ